MNKHANTLSETMEPQTMDEGVTLSGGDQDAKIGHRDIFPGESSHK